MRINVDNDPQRFMRSGHVGGGQTFALLFILGAFSFAARAQTVGPITPNQSQTPQQTPPESAKPTPATNGEGSLAGIWKLNRDQSDDPRQRLEQASSAGGGGWGQQGPAGGGGWGGRPGWGGWGGPGNGGGGGWNRSGRPISEDGAVDMSEFSQLSIEQSDSGAKVTGATGRVLAQYSADSGTKNDSDKDAAKKSKDSLSAPPVAQWQGDQLVTRVNGPRGVKITRIYELSYAGKQLYVTTRLESPRFNQPVSIRFVYDRGRSSSN